MATNPFNPYNNNTRPVNDNDQVALFIDWDNLVISNYADRGTNRPNLEVIMQKAQQYGTLVLARAYAEWSNTLDRLEVYKAGVETVYAPVFHADRDLSGQMGRGKSLADPVMVTDCVDFLHLLPTVGTYVLVTGDKDMMPVVRLAKMRGRRVVVIGPDYVANVLQQITDEFVPYRVLLAQAAPPPDPYAAYYAQMGYTPPAPGIYSSQPQITPPQQPQPPAQTRDRNGRRITNNRRGSTPQPPAPQPYSQVQVPVPQPGYNYGYPAQPQPGYPTQPVAGAYPTQPQPGYPTQPVAPGTIYPTTNFIYPANYTPPMVEAIPVPAPANPGYTFTPPATQVSPVTPVTSAQPVAAAVATPAPAKSVLTPPPTPTKSATPGQLSSPSHSSNFEEIKEIIRAILTQRAGSGRGQMRARDLKEELLRRIPSFNERRYGYSKFKALLTAVEEAGVLQMDQLGHILWVSLPGTPRIETEPGEYDETALATEALATDLEDDDDEEEAAEELPEEAAEEQAAESAAADPLEAATEASTETLAVSEPESEAAIEARKEYRIEERTTSLVEAPIGAHSTRFRQPTVPAAQAKTDLGPKPALLEQPFYQDVIMLIEDLRHRNKWLGYELLLSNVRDYLSKQGMIENEAKSQAGSMLSKLLSENVLKMAIEVHSRGARKMRVQVAYLQGDNKSVKFALGSKTLQIEADLAAEQAVEQPIEQSVEQPVEGVQTEPAMSLAPEVVQSHEQTEPEQVATPGPVAELAPVYAYNLGYYGSLSYPGTPMPVAEPEVEAAPVVEQAVEVPAEVAPVEHQPEIQAEHHHEAHHEVQAEQPSEPVQADFNPQPDVEATVETSPVAETEAEAEEEEGEPEHVSENAATLPNLAAHEGRKPVRRAPRRRPPVKVPAVTGNAGGESTPSGSDNA